MAFDKSTRNRLARFVGDARGILTEEFTRQCKQIFGIDPDTGAISELNRLTHLNDTQRATAQVLRETFNHYSAGSPSSSKTDVLLRIIREQAFTVLNRLCALRMAEARGILVESVVNEYKSKGFQLYESVAGPSLGETGDSYRNYLFSIFDELALDLASLFDRFSPQGRLFPTEAALRNVLAEINHLDLEALWTEDETIGWLYQYFNSQEERKKMRDESTAPRNSRELAVRNQFFTPRYVVEFLTDNTLGRIWYEMTQGDTTLKEQCRYLVRRPTEIFLKTGDTAPEQPKQENLSQEDLLKQPVHISHRPLKDPRTILMLDPACGSMHFGLYAFDLFEVIYDEAWALEEKLSADALSRPLGMKSLHATYAGKDAFLKDVPRLIIENNLHGIDIDPRCAQIAGLSLWLRAQKAWQRLGLKPAERPAIKHSNIVCAEPMPGEKELLREFVEREFPAAERAVCLRLLETIFDKMQLAGEAGSLLKIEEEIRSAIEEARRQATTPRLFDTDVRSLTSEDFWERIEERIYAALRDYAEQAENGGGFQRRLFAEDAARGFAFIDVCRKRYDVVVMNPPYGDFSDNMLAIAKTAYEGFSSNIYSAFWSRALALAVGGKVGALTSRTFLTLSQFTPVREMLLRPNSCLSVVADLGAGVLDGAAVDTCASVASCEPTAELRPICFLQLDQATNRGELLLDTIQRGCVKAYWWPQGVFRKLPGSRFFYWAPAEILSLFSRGWVLEGSLAEVRPGLLTGDDFRFLSLWWELPSSSPERKQWFTFAKGGDYERYYADLPFNIKWHDDGREVKAFAAMTVGSVSKWIFNERYYFREGLTFPNSGMGFSVRCLPANSIISVKGQGIFCVESADARALLGLLNSPLVHTMLMLFNPGKDVQAGDVKQLPFGRPRPEKIGAIRTIISQILDTLRRSHQLDETSPLFSALSLSPVKDAQRAGSIFEQPHKIISEVASQMVNLEDSLDPLIYEAYSLPRSDIDALTSRAKRRPNPLEFIEHSLAEICVRNGGTIIWLSFAFGSAFGRWDIRYATGEQAAPDLPDPFAPLPVCPPGQLQNAQGLPARPEDVPAAYPVCIPWDGILVDDPNHPLDLERRVREVIEIIWSGKDGGPTAEAIEHEACEILGVKSLRDYFRKPAGFFADHLKRYSKSRRQAPIYWPLSTASGSYTLWIYYHRLTDQTLFSAINNCVEPKLAQISSEATQLRSRPTRSANDDRELEELSDLELELRDFRDELLRIAKFWKPNLNDGVLLTAAPLWKLFQFKPWQKKLKEAWGELEQGDYDWAHIALSIWPERVRDKCKTDRSMAIAHGLEELHEALPANTKKKRKKITRAEDQLFVEDSE